MMESLAYAYINSDYISVYVSLPEQEQIIFYWNIYTAEQRRLPRWRLSRQQIPDARIETLTDRGCVVYLANRRAEFSWYEFNAPENNPAHKGSLVNFADWHYDPAFKPNSPTGQSYQQPEYTAHYAEPRYDAELEQE